MSDQQEEPGYGERDDAATSPQTGGGVDPEQVDADVASEDDDPDDAA
jgi:hypothetical protein